MARTVEERYGRLEDLASFERIAACGTAALCPPVSETDDLDTGDKSIISATGEAGPVTTALYNKIRAIQYGEEPDTHGWCEVIE